MPGMWVEYDMNWIKRILHKFTGASQEMARLRLRASMLEMEVDELGNTCNELMDQLEQERSQARQLRAALKVQQGIANGSVKAYQALQEEMEANGLTKSQLDAQAAIQLEMDGHRADLERELSGMREENESLRKSIESAQYSFSSEREELKAMQHYYQVMMGMRNAAEARAEELALELDEDRVNHMQELLVAKNETELHKAAYKSMHSELEEHRKKIFQKVCRTA